MKWMFLLLVLIIGGWLAYYAFQSPQGDPTTPTGTAKLFVQAALADDTDLLRSICRADAIDDAQSLASEIQAAQPDARSFKWKITAPTSPEFTAVSAVFEGRVIALEMIEDDGEYRIAHVSR